MKHKRIILIMLIVIWMIIIFIFSSQVSSKSTSTSKQVVGFVVDKLNITKDMSNKERLQFIEDLQTPVRKFTHFSIYAIGGMISFTLLNEFNITKKKKIIVSFALCALYAITDEIHQYFVLGRSCEIGDVIIDSCGAILGIAILYFITRKKVKGSKK